MPGQAFAIGLGSAEKTQSITAITETAIYNARVTPAAAAEAAQRLAAGKDSQTTIKNAASLGNRTVTEVPIASIQRIEWAANAVSIAVTYKGPNGADKLMFGVEDIGLRQACINTLLSLRSDLWPAEIPLTPFEAIKGYLILVAITAAVGGATIMAAMNGPVEIDNIHDRRFGLKQLVGTTVNGLGPTGTIGIVTLLVVFEIVLLVQAAKNPGTKFVAERIPS